MITPLEITTSKVSSAKGSTSDEIRYTWAFVTCMAARFARALSTISSVRSTPKILPCEPTSREATKRSNPAPQPTSRTVLPFSIRSMINGLPTPQKELNSSSGISVRSSLSYPNKSAPVLPTGYLKYPAAEVDTAEYFFLIAVRI